MQRSRRVSMLKIVVCTRDGDVLFAGSSCLDTGARGPRTDDSDDAGGQTEGGAGAESGFFRTLASGERERVPPTREWEIFGEVQQVVAKRGNGGR
jgi:hypothetical protein